MPSLPFRAKSPVADEFARLMSPRSVMVRRVRVALVSLDVLRR